MALSQDFALDSQSFTYLVMALEHVEEPQGPLAAEKTALFRSFLYSGGWHFLTPTVDLEWRRIPDEKRRAIHESWNAVHFGTVNFYIAEQELAAHTRAKEFQCYHSGLNDCLILAEAEILGARKLLSYDHAFVQRLKPHTLIELVLPSEHWASMKISPGSRPCVEPAAANPLTGESWWRV